MPPCLPWVCRVTIENLSGHSRVGQGQSRPTAVPVVTDCSWEVWEPIPALRLQVLPSFPYTRPPSWSTPQSRPSFRSWRNPFYSTAWPKPFTHSCNSWSPWGIITQAPRLWSLLWAGLSLRGDWWDWLKFTKKTEMPLIIKRTQNRKCSRNVLFLKPVTHRMFRFNADTQHAAVALTPSVS